MQPTNAAFFSLFLGDAQLLSFAASHSPPKILCAPKIVLPWPGSAGSVYYCQVNKYLHMLTERIVKERLCNLCLAIHNVFSVAS